MAVQSITTRERETDNSHTQTKAICREADGHKQTERQTDIHRQRDRQTYTDRETDRQTYTDKRNM